MCSVSAMDFQGAVVAALLFAVTLHAASTLSAPEYRVRTVDTSCFAPENVSVVIVPHGEHHALNVTWSSNEIPENVILCHKVVVCNEGCALTTLNETFALLAPLNLWKSFSVSVHGSCTDATRCLRNDDMGASYNDSLEEPEEATGLIVTSVGAHSMTISWNNSDSGDGIQPSGYLLAICDPSDLDRCLVNKTVSFAPREYQVRVDDLNANTTYTVVLTAFLADSSAIYYGRSLDVGVTTQTSGQPKILNIPDASKPSITISIKQAPVSSNYTVTMDKVTANSTTKTVEKLDAQVKDAPVTLNITDIDPASHYEVTVKNCSGRCEVEASLHVQAKVGSPSAVRSLSVTQTKPGEVTYSWEKPYIPRGPVDGYIVSTMNLENRKVVITEVPGNTTQYTQITVQYTEYRVNVQAYNTIKPYGLKKAGPAASVNFKSLGEGPVPPIPQIADISEHEVVLNWTKPIDARHQLRHYVIRLDTSHVNMTTADSSIWLECLKTWHHYTASVSSCTAYTCGPPKKVEFRTDVGTPTEPQSLNYTKVSLHSVTITWKRPELAEGPLDGYMVTLSNRSSSFQIITKSTKLSVGNLASSCHYKITVAAFNTGAHGTKEGPAVEISVNTLQPGKVSVTWLTVTSVTLMIVIPVFAFVFLVLYIIYKHHISRIEQEELLVSSE